LLEILLMYMRKDVIDLLAKIFNVQVTAETDPKMVRPHDNRIIIGNFKKIKSQTGWEPKFSLEDSLNTVIKYF